MNTHYTLRDITVIIAVRLHAGNDWVRERLESLRKILPAAIPIRIVDYGSGAGYSETLETTCARNNLAYGYIDDAEVFSLSVARNRGFELTDTELVLFSDIDFVFEGGFFTRLLELCNALPVREHSLLLGMPAYHLSRGTTEMYMQCPDVPSKERLLTGLGYRGVHAAAGRALEYIAPYSNVFACHRDTYALTGGYSESFRGHGSDDFEFFYRYLEMARSVPRPYGPLFDVYAPNAATYFAYKTYQGFRRYQEMLILPAQYAGLKTFHLWHPRRQDNDWYRQRDRKRQRFFRVVSHYGKRSDGLLDMDFLVRSGIVSCEVPEGLDPRVFLPLRQMGVTTRLKALDQPAADEPHCARLLWDGRVDAGVTGLSPGVLPGSLHYHVPGQSFAPVRELTGELKGWAMTYRQWLLLEAADRQTGDVLTDSDVPLPDVIGYANQSHVAAHCMHISFPNSLESVRGALQRAQSARLVVSIDTALALTGFLVGTDTWIKSTSVFVSLLPQAGQQITDSEGGTWLAYPAADYTEDDRLSLLVRLLHGYYYVNPYRGPGELGMPVRRALLQAMYWERGLPGAGLEKDLLPSDRSYAFASLNICRGLKCFVITVWGIVQPFVMVLNRFRSRITGGR